MRETSKDITIDDQEYRVELLPAAVGNWVFTQIQNGKYTNEDVFTSVQAHCFDVCFRYKATPDGNRIGVKVYDRAQKKWLIPDLARDLFTVNRLYDAVIDFNFTDFFAKLEALEAASRAATSDTSLQSSQTT